MQFMIYRYIDTRVAVSSMSASGGCTAIGTVRPIWLNAQATRDFHIWGTRSVSRSVQACRYATLTVYIPPNDDKCFGQAGWAQLYGRKRDLCFFTVESDVEFSIVILEASEIL